jgi:hypothetical protein
VTSISEVVEVVSAAAVEVVAAAVLVVSGTVVEVVEVSAVVVVEGPLPQATMIIATSKKGRERRTRER